LPAQAFPQAPQLALSLWTSTQEPLQSIEPEEHVAAPPLPELLTEPPVLVSLPEPPAPPEPAWGAEYVPHEATKAARNPRTDAEKKEPMSFM